MSAAEQIPGALQDDLPQEHGDYRDPDTGLLMCGKCRTKKQVRMEVAGRVIECSCLCECSTERLAAEERERQQRERSIEIERLRSEGCRDRLLADCTFAADWGDNPQMPKAHAYVRAWSGMLENGDGLLLYGPVGTGKSFIAGCIANALIDAGVPVMVTSIPRIMNELGAAGLSGRVAYLAKLDRFPLLVIDDLGTERTTDYGMEQVFSVIDGRYRTGKPLIVTTNVPLREMRNAAQPLGLRRVYDRILERCQPICVDGKSYREEKARRNRERMRAMLDAAMDA